MQVVLYIDFSCQIISYPSLWDVAVLLYLCALVKKNTVFPFSKIMFTDDYVVISVTCLSIKLSVAYVNSPSPFFFLSYLKYFSWDGHGSFNGLFDFIRKTFILSEKSLVYFDLCILV